MVFNEDLIALKAFIQKVVTRTLLSDATQLLYNWTLSPRQVFAGTAAEKYRFGNRIGNPFSMSR
ncbi:hypothetical protein FC17_GL001073 [Secundilactobacillus paracollinoides DSM 15502 = JCM 11969]|nr:hypothetical protein FC17_GL001073 [Secundilactobacillus paracollinoides DSM 15502 = JCM 11969]